MLNTLKRAVSYIIPKVSAFAGLVIALWPLSVVAQDVIRCAAIEEVPLTAVKIQDNFWSPKLKIYRENTIPMRGRICASD